MTLREMLKDKELLEAAEDADCEVALCEYVSNRHGLELTLAQAEALMDKAQNR